MLCSLICLAASAAVCGVINVGTEQLLTLSQLAKRLPRHRNDRPVHPSTCHRWRRPGVRGRPSRVRARGHERGPFSRDERRARRRPSRRAHRELRDGEPGELPGGRTNSELRSRDPRSGRECPGDAVDEGLRRTVVKRERDTPLGRLDTVDEGPEQLDATCSRELPKPGHASEENHKTSTDPDEQRTDVHGRRWR